MIREIWRRIVGEKCWNAHHRRYRTPLCPDCNKIRTYKAEAYDTRRSARLEAADGSWPLKKAR